jgi:hypothetical protein
MLSRRLAAVSLVIAATVVSLGARQLKSGTLAAFDRYVLATESRMKNELAGISPFLWIDRQPQGERPALVNRLRSGEIISARLETRDAGKSIDVSNGMLHHWIGTVLIPGASLANTLAVVQDYPRYPERFAPMIQRATITSHTGDDHYKARMRTSMKKMMVTVVLDADYAIEYRTLSPTRVVSSSVASNIMEVSGAGTSSERKTAADTIEAYLWRLNTYCWFDARTEGVYEQCESISLTREPPFGVGWLVKPFVTSIPRETLEQTLGAVRTAVLSKK